MPSTLRPLASAILVVLLAAACAGGAAVPSQPASSASSGTVDSPAAAFARVVAQNPQFAGIGPLNTEMIGQCCWYEAEAAPGGFEVRVHVGWGDCQAGCINKHQWTYAVSTSGSVSLVAENGDPVPAGVLPAGGGPGASIGVGGATGIAGRVTAGPTCPVVRVGDPTCDPRPVPGAVIVVRTMDGAIVARATADADGAYSIGLPPGMYSVTSEPVAGFPAAPGPTQVTVLANAQTPVDIGFDTGIR